MSSSTSRPLYAWEIQEAQRVFGHRLDYAQVRIHEKAAWTNTTYRINAMLRRAPYKEVLNAVTLGNHLFFPVRLLEAPVQPGEPAFFKLPWLIHELTHAWQYQHLGWRYLASALNSQIRMGAKAYDFGGEDGLLEAVRQGKRLAHFNLEQQGDIARFYYARLVKNADVSAWEPFIKEFQE